jgi:hypothetical protein
MRKPHHVLHLRSTGGFLGAENVIIELCRHASAADVRSTIGIVFDVGDPPAELEAVARRHGIPVVRFDCRSRVDFRALAEIRRLAIDTQVDIIHTHGYREDLYALLAMTGAKKVATNHLWKKTTPPCGRTLGSMASCCACSTLSSVFRSRSLPICFRRECRPRAVV